MLNKGQEIIQVNNKLKNFEDDQPKNTQYQLFLRCNPKLSIRIPMVLSKDEAKYHMRIF